MIPKCPVCQIGNSRDLVQLREQDGSLLAIHSHKERVRGSVIHRYDSTCNVGSGRSYLSYGNVVRLVPRVPLKPYVPMIVLPCSGNHPFKGIQAMVLCNHCNKAYCDICSTNHKRGPHGRLVLL